MGAGSWAIAVAEKQTRERAHRAVRDTRRMKKSQQETLKSICSLTPKTQPNQKDETSTRPAGRLDAGGSTDYTPQELGMQRTGLRDKASKLRRLISGLMRGTGTIAL